MFTEEMKRAHFESFADK